MKIWAMESSAINHILQVLQCLPVSLSDGLHLLLIMTMMAMPIFIKINGALKHLYGQEDQLFENIGEGKFKDVSTESGQYFQKEMVGRGCLLW